MEIRVREIMTELLVRTGRLHPGGPGTVVGEQRMLEGREGGASCQKQCSGSLLYSRP